jgi:transcriptional regulator with XRE-family HTH domain
VKKSVGERIKRIRQGQNINRDDVADELDISNSAYSKIERGEIDPNVTRLYAIAKILKVNVIDFFQDKKDHLFSEEQNRNYGYASKGDIEELMQTVRLLKLEVEKLKNELGKAKGTRPKRKK